MPISEKNRKILWGKSGNKCAMCRYTLVFDSTDKDTESIVGEECHIISGAKNGPRNDPKFPKENIDDISNIILLCRLHHKQIDDQVDTYTPEILRSIKYNHEKWVKEKLNRTDQKSKIKIQRYREQIPDKLHIVKSGKEMFEIASGAYSFYMNYSEGLTDDELDLVSSFLQNVKDWTESSQELEPMQRVEAGRHLDKELKELHDKNLFAFAGIEKQKIVGADEEPVVFPVLHLTTCKATDPNIIFDE